MYLDKSSMRKNTNKSSSFACKDFLGNEKGAFYSQKMVLLSELKWLFQHFKC